MADHAIGTFGLPIGSHNEHLVPSAMIKIEPKIMIYVFYSYSVFHVEYLTIFISPRLNVFIRFEMLMITAYFIMILNKYHG